MGGGGRGGASGQARPAELTLAVGAGDRERFGWLVEKAVELGVTRVVPLETERTAGVPAIRDAHLTSCAARRSRRIKQCGAAWAPRWRSPLPLAAFVASAPSRATHWLADAGGRSAAAALDARR